MSSPRPHLLKLAPQLDPKPWGGRRLAALGKKLPGESIGESLESGSSARVVGGVLDGARLGDLARDRPDWLLGSRGRAVAGDPVAFPLLAKFIDAAEHLSVQVHPNDAQAPPGKRGKCEAWLIVDAEPGAELIVGVAGALDGDHIEARLIRRAVRQGDALFVPPGVVHAIGAGVLLYEIQQPSDVTYRLFDWGRARELHMSDGRRVARRGATALALQPAPFGPARELVVACEFFALERRRFAGVSALEALPTSCRVLTLLEGSLRVNEIVLAAGDSAVAPAAAPAIMVEGDATVLVAWVPDLTRDVVEPLRAAGHTRASIGLVDGVTFVRMA